MVSNPRGYPQIIHLWMFPSKPSSYWVPAFMETSMNSSLKGCPAPTLVQGMTKEATSHQPKNENRQWWLVVNLDYLDRGNLANLGISNFDQPYAFDSGGMNRIWPTRIPVKYSLKQLSSRNPRAKSWSHKRAPGWKYEEKRFPTNRKKAHASCKPLRMVQGNASRQITTCENWVVTNELRCLKLLVRKYIYVCVCVYIYICVCVCVYIYVYTECLSVLQCAAYGRCKIDARIRKGRV